MGNAVANKARALTEDAAVPQSQVRYFKPAAFDWLAFDVRHNATTGAPEPYTADGTAYDVADSKPAGTKTYYVSNAASNGYAAGSDSNDGLSKSAPFLTITKALSMADRDIVMLNPTRYTRASSAFTPTTRDVQIIGDGGTATLGANDNIAWTLESGATSTYRATRSSVAWVWDAGVLDDNGDYTRLANAGSYAGSGDLAAGEWYSNGTSVWVRTSDSRSLVGSTTIRVFLDVSVGAIVGDITVYLENIQVEGGRVCQSAASSASAFPTVYAKNCKFKYQCNASVNGAFGMLGGVSVLQGCEVALSRTDGINYTTYSGSYCQSVEIDCTSRDNGWGGGGINNGSTTHDGNTVSRVGGRYYGNEGPNVADVATDPADTTSWNVGVSAWGSTADTSGQQNANFVSQATMWLDSCSGEADPAEAGAYQMVASSAGAVIRHRNFAGLMRNYRMAGNASTIAGY